MRPPSARLCLSAAARWVVIAAIGLWLTMPLFTARNLGTGDAIWYALNLGDAVTQFHAGVFPVFVGQSAYQFNGSVYPFRVAPYYQYLGGFLDLLTSRHLGFVALEHLTAAVSMFGGLISAYLCLNWLAPGRRWTALLLAVLYASCPGVMGLVYAQDLYMSTMAVPWVPVALAGVLKAYEDSSPKPLAVAAVGIAALWWAHAPIALWISIAVALLLVPLAASLIRQPRRWLPGAGAFALLALYPFASALFIRTRGETVIPYVVDRAKILWQVAHAFPGCILPLNLRAPSLDRLQVGYGLWLVLGLAGYAGWRWRRSVAVALGFCALLLVLLYPVPWLDAALWKKLPEYIVDLTLYWPMQRLCIAVAGVAVVAAQYVLARMPDDRSAVQIVLVILGVAAAWSVEQSGVMLAGVRASAYGTEQTALLMRPENAAIQRHSYNLFPRLPDYMSQGVMDPAMESRLLRPDGSILKTDFDGVSPPKEVFSGHIDANPGILDLDPQIVLKPGKRYALTFAFFPGERYVGVLQLVGPHTFREYALPDSGEALAFGVGRDQPKSLSLWTTADAPEKVQLRFIPTAPGSHPADFTPFARYSLIELDPEDLPVQLESLIPYRAAVRSPVAAILETPRLYVPGYVATVNGRSAGVVRSQEGFVAVPVPAGKSAVTVAFRGPWALAAAFWVSFLGWIAVGLGAGYGLTFRPSSEAARDCTRS